MLLKQCILPWKNLPQYVVYEQGERDGDETLTNSWWMHLTNKVLSEIKNPSEITNKKSNNFDQEFGLP